MSVSVTLNYPIVLYYRFYAVELEEQKRLEIVDYNPEYTLREFANANNPNNEYNELSIIYGGLEVKKIDSIIIEGKMKFHQDIDTIKLKDLESDLAGKQLTVYINEELGVGDVGDEIPRILLILEQILNTIGYYLIAIEAKDILKQNLIDPIVMRKAVQKKNEWSLDEFCKTFEIDSFKRAGKILRFCGFKKDINTNNYRSKKFIEKTEANDIEGVG